MEDLDAATRERVPTGRGRGWAWLFVALALACSPPATEPDRQDAEGVPGGLAPPDDANEAARRAPIAATGAPAERPDPDVPLDFTSPDARHTTHEMLLEDLARERHPSDGGGRAWLVDENGQPTHPRYPAGSRQRFAILFEVGDQGIDEGGGIYLYAPPFWGWEPPQVRDPNAPGATEAEILEPKSSDGRVASLELDDSYEGLLLATVRGRGLRAGERLRLVYGAGPAGARVDRYREDRTRLPIAVDGDGDGVRALIVATAVVDITSGPPTRIQLTLPSTARPGEEVGATVAVLDALGNLVDGATGELEVDAAGRALGLPPRIALLREHGGRRTVTFRPAAEGIHRVGIAGIASADAGSGPGLAGLQGESNPLLIRADAPHVLWGDLHGHSQISDGTATPAQYYDYARRVAALDVAALTDHDHWGMRFLDANPDLWQQIVVATREAHSPGSFVALLGYEWTSWLHGHRHVLYFDSPEAAADGLADESSRVLSSLDPRYDTPARLWRALSGRAALTFAHHSAGGPIGTNWHYPPDPVLEPITEIASVHGSSEALDGPVRIYDPVPGNFARDALDVGYRLGFIGSGDSHDGHPGLAHVGSEGAPGGLAAIYSESRTRSGVLEALRARRVYATNGPRIHLHVDIDGAGMGETVAARPDRESVVDIEVVATAPIDRVDIVRSGVTASIPGEGRLVLSHTRRIPPLRAGEYHYVRVVQRDGGAAWSSPIFIDPPREP